MKRKKLLSAAVSAVLGITSAFSAASMSALADTYTGGGNASSAVTKPELTVSVDGVKYGTVFTFDEIKSMDNKVTFSLNVSGAKQAYSSVGIHLNYSNALKIAKDDDGFEMIDSGKAVSKLMVLEPKVDPTIPDYDPNMNGYFLCAFGGVNYGNDGEMWSFTVELPADAKAGDVYPIDIFYKATEAAEDIFINKENDDDGLNMQAYAFTQGIFNEDTNNNFAASAADIAKCSALAKINKSYDGYIAIADDAPVTTTTVTTTAKTSSNSFNIIKDQISYDSGSFVAYNWVI